jgi:hypothetical protein
MYFSVSGPIPAAQRRIRCGVHSAYRRWELGMCSGVVVCLPFR